MTAAPVPASPPTHWTLQLPQQETVLYRGVVSFDGAGVSGFNTLYPAPNVAVAAIALLTFGLSNEISKKRQKDLLTDQANMVLVSYQAVLGNYTYRELMQRGLERCTTGSTRNLVDFSQKPGGDWFVESLPAFALTQDQRAIVLDNAIRIHAPGTALPIAYESSVRVVSTAIVAPDAVEYWTADAGRNIKETSAMLLGLSLDLALREAASGPSSANEAFATIRYSEGGAEKMERAQKLGARCGRMLLRTLRGGLMSVPVQDASTAANKAEACDDAQIVAQ